MADDLVLLNIVGPRATITLNRPSKLNALDPAMLALLDHCCAQLERDSAVRVVVLTGAGDRAFCAGADITAWASLKPLEMWQGWIREGHRVFDRVARMRQPVIAAVNGYAFGGGLELAMAADIRIGAEHAEFALPETGIGTVPGWGGTQRLPALVGPGRAKQLIFTGAKIDAATAVAWGLLNTVVPRADLMERAAELAAQIAERAPIAVQLAKQAIDANLSGDAGAVLEGMAGALAATTADGQEGIASFAERRPPQFSGS